MKTIICILVILSCIKLIFNLRVKVNFTKAQPTEKPKEFNITDYIGHLGNYKDSKIAEFVKLDDGRVFEFESIAVKAPNGIYTVREPDKIHIRVQDLLYKYKFTEK